MTNIDIFEFVKSIKENSYDSYGLYTRRSFETAVTAAVKDLTKADLVHIIQDYRTAKEFFPLEMNFYRYKTNGGEVIDSLNFEQAIVDCWKKAIASATGRMVGSGRRTGFGL
jgi:hypothetical protein